ncbi:MAG TPA: L,D-transpeptidase [Candidatus Saccharimonadales bacterium]|nr:L,D-transpeptidase [Candidatus Saccharimonadales bacterium]
MKTQTTKSTTEQLARTTKRAALAALHRQLVLRHDMLWASAAAALVAVWLVGGLCFTKVVVGDSQLPARSTPLALRGAIDQQLLSYHLAVRYPDHSQQTFVAQNLGLVPDVNATTARLQQQLRRPWRWIAWWRPIHVTVVEHIDQTALDAFITRHMTVTVKQAHDASITVTSGVIQLTKSAGGQAYSLPDAASTLTRTVSSLQTTPLSLQLQQVVPPISTGTLTRLKPRLNAILNQKVHIALDGQTITPTSSDIASWLTLTSNDRDDNVDIGVDRPAIAAYIGALANPHEQAAQNQIVDDSGHVIISGKNGVSVAGQDTTIAGLASALLSAKGASASLSIQTAPFATTVVSSQGKRIEVDVTAKRMYVYQDDVLLRTILVSAGAPATPTVTGTYHIYAKYVSQDMTGPNADGTTYFQPAVPWVNYFYGGFAIHGNYWRPASWFGNVNSSHGCVGVTVDDGQWIYEWAPIGTPIYIHT